MLNIGHKISVNVCNLCVNDRAMELPVVVYKEFVKYIFQTFQDFPEFKTNTILQSKHGSCRECYNEHDVAYLSLCSVPTHRFYEFAVLYQLPFVFDLVGCHPRLDLVSKTLGDQKKKRERNIAGEAERERQRHISEYMQRLVFNSHGW